MMVTMLLLHRSNVPGVCQKIDNHGSPCSQRSNVSAAASHLVSCKQAGQRQKPKQSWRWLQASSLGWWWWRGIPRPPYPVPHMQLHDRSMNEPSIGSAVRGRRPPTYQHLPCRPRHSATQPHQDLPHPNGQLPTHQHAVVRCVLPSGGLHPKVGGCLLHSWPVNHQVSGAATHKGGQAAGCGWQRRQRQHLQGCREEWQWVQR